MPRSSVEPVSDFLASMVAAASYESAPRGQAGQEGARLQLEWLVRWPPDLFAVTWALLQRTGTYRFAASPPEGIEWPRSRDWDDMLESTVQSWIAEFGSDSSPTDPVLRKAIEVITSLSTKVSMEDLQHRSTWDSSSDSWALISEVLTLHAFADQACAQVGMLGSVMQPQRRPAGQQELFENRGVFRL
jgi:hypothetical protein